jgi:RNA polymerase sigma-70 factor (ECF subfamily)
MLRRKTTAGQLEPLGSAAAVEPFFDPELRVLAAEGQQTVKVAFQTAFDELLPPQKVLLAYHYLDRLTYRQIGKILRVDASTVSRRLADIRAALLEGTRRGVLAAPGMSRTSVDEVIGMVRSQLDLSVSRLLRTERETKASDG